MSKLGDRCAQLQLQRNSGVSGDALNVIQSHTQHLFEPDCHGMMTKRNLPALVETGEVNPNLFVGDLSNGCEDRV
jgi:hypothetical protein